jgi:4-hydroxy-tetrahydrodipicolinate reductase
MGREIAEVVYSDSSVSLRAAIEYQGHPMQGSDYGTCIGKGASAISVGHSISSVDCTGSVVIDFSSSKSLPVLLPAAAEKNVPVIIGITGLTADELGYAKSFSSKIPVLVSPNMSLGVNLLFRLTELVADRLNNNFDIEIIEAHHRFKKDAPSGTAKRLGEIAAASLGMSYDDCIRDGRKGISPVDRSRQEIGMHAVRGGDIVGDHTVLFAGIGERVELRHMAHSRSTFAQGAVAAAKWISGKRAGFYSMRDVLGF